jgi:hypothetical protein
MAQRGIVFFASGERYLEEAIRAVGRSMRFNDVPHAIFCSEPPKKQTGAEIRVFNPSKNMWLDRIDCLRNSPFDETIYLDADCAVLAPIVELFDLLGVYEIAAAHAPRYRGQSNPDVPRAFFELNCGVIVLRRSDRIAELFETWRSVYRTWYRTRPFDRCVADDQPSFRHAVWKSRIPIYVLGPEYNWRPAFPSFLAARPKILHGYHADPDAIARIANAHVGTGACAFGPLMPNLTDLSQASGDIG